MVRGQATRARAIMSILMPALRHLPENISGEISPKRTSGCLKGLAKNSRHGSPRRLMSNLTMELLIEFAAAGEQTGQAQTCQGNG
jgi:hypothetical protein